MMEQRPEDQHLTYDDLLKALAQTDDQSAPCRQHLAVCDACRQALQRVETRFARIGQMARKSAPAPGRTFRLVQGRTAAGHRRLKPLLAMGTVAALFLVFASWWSQQGPVPLPQMAAQRLEEDRLLMQQVDALVENALPPAYRGLTAFSGPIFDEDLINRIVPSIEEDEDSLT